MAGKSIQLQFVEEVVAPVLFEGASYGVVEIVEEMDSDYLVGEVRKRVVWVAFQEGAFGMGWEAFEDG